jgi:uncharacterized repeat protein (TIGR03803 family)
MVPIRAYGDLRVTFLMLLFLAINAEAQRETILHTFNCQTDGCAPSGNLAIDKEGNLYGTTSTGGPNQSDGTVFKLTAAGTLSVLRGFSASGGGEVYGLFPQGVTLDQEGNLYGTTTSGGTTGSGIVFKLTPSGTETVLHNFACPTDGCSSRSALAIDKNGNLYGTTLVGGAYSFGTVFELSPSGNLRVLHSFNNNGTDGFNATAGVSLDAEDNVYGTTSLGGANGFGTVFKITQSGKETILHSFNANGVDGFYPEAPVILDAKGNLYGTTSYGGAIGIGTVFELSPSGHETILHSFLGAADGFSPYASLLLDAKGTLYGTTSYGGSVDLGSAFALSSSHVKTTLHSFVRNGTDGYFPYSALVTDSAGNFYGTTASGGNGGSECSPYPRNGCGVVFKIAP